MEMFFWGPLLKLNEITAGVIRQFKLSTGWIQTKVDHDDKESPVLCFTSFLEVKNMVNILPFGLRDKEYSLIK